MSVSLVCLASRQNSPQEWQSESGQVSNVVKDHLIGFGVVGKNPSMEDLPRSSLCTTVDHKTLKILPRGVNLCQLDNASMIALKSVEWFNLQHIFFILDKAKAIPIRIRS